MYCNCSEKKRISKYLIFNQLTVLEIKKKVLDDSKEEID